MLVKIMQVSETNNTEELELGEYEITSIEDLAGQVNAEIRGNQLICEWGNGEGEDIFEFEILEGDEVPYETNANEIGFDFDLVIKINREPATPQEWEMVSEFIEENFPLSLDESSHGYSSKFCTFNLPSYD